MPENLDSNDFIYANRKEAVDELLAILPKKLMQDEKWILLALSRGSVEMTSMLANSLGLYFDIFIVKSIVAPENDECEIAMVSETKEIVIQEALVDSFGIDENYIYEEAKRIYDEKIVENINKYRKSLPLSDLKDRSVLLVDEGCETGLSTMCAIKSALNLHTKKVSIATPVIAEDLFHTLDLKVDKVYTNHRIVHFISVMYYYEELERLKSKNILELLQKCKYYLPYQKEIN